jgi:hypothetical protein
VVEEAAEKPTPKKKTRRGSRGGRGRKKPAKPVEAAAQEDGDGAVPGDGTVPEPRIHVPDPTLGQEPELPASEPVSADGNSQSEDGEAPKPRKKTRRGSRGGRNRRKKPVAADANGGPETTPAADPEPVSDAYVPMSEWIDEVDGR